MVFFNLISKGLLIPILLYFMTFMSYCKCRKMPFYGILWHSPYDINVIKYCNMGIKRTILVKNFDIRLQKNIWTQFYLPPQPTRFLTCVSKCLALLARPKKELSIEPLQLLLLISCLTTRFKVSIHRQKNASVLWKTDEHQSL